LQTSKNSWSARRVFGPDPDGMLAVDATDELEGSVGWPDEREHAPNTGPSTATPTANHRVFTVLTPR
jgi:hypothetical protein